MTYDQKVIRNKVDLIKLAKTPGNVSRACKMIGLSRDSFYHFKEPYDQVGELDLQEIIRKKLSLKLSRRSGFGNGSPKNCLYTG